LLNDRQKSWLAFLIFHVSSKTISMDEFCAFYIPMPAVDSAPPPQVQQANPYQGYEGYTAVGSHMQGNVASVPSHGLGYLPQAMPSLMQIEGPAQDAPVQIKRNTAPRASRNAPPAAFPGSMPPAGNQQVFCFELPVLKKDTRGVFSPLTPTGNGISASEVTWAGGLSDSGCSPSILDGSTACSTVSAQVYHFCLYKS
jgi:hypothetical protein